MKKTIWIIVIPLIILVGYFLWQANNTEVTIINNGTSGTPVNTLNTFTSANQDISFKYPDIFSATQKNNIITLHHQINYANHPACDFKGDAPNSPTLTDFNVTIQEINKPLVETVEQIDPTIATTSFSGEDLVVSVGFIDRTSLGSFPGYSITSSVEGCGFITYYLPISTSRTLVIKKDMIGALADIVDPAVRQKILAVPAVISPDQSTAIFNSIMQSFQVR